MSDLLLFQEIYIYGNSEEESAAGADHAFHPHASFMGFHNLFDECEPQAGAANMSRFFVVHPVKFCEQFVHAFRRNAYPLIRHPYDDLVAVVAGANVDIAALWRKFDCVGEKIC
jgi:hypothetical protein